MGLWSWMDYGSGLLASKRAVAIDQDYQLRIMTSLVKSEEGVITNDLLPTPTFCPFERYGKIFKYDSPNPPLASPAGKQQHLAIALPTTSFC